MMKKIAGAWVLILAASGAATALAEADLERGKQFFQVCVACHGENGEGAKSLNAPRLSRQHDWYIVRQLNNFKSGVRGAHAKDIYGQQMRPMAQILATDEQVNDVAAYLSTLK